jgi:hypothetical protein
MEPSQTLPSTSPSTSPSPSPSTKPALVSDLDVTTKKYYEGASEYQRRRHIEWRENYSLYRDKVQTNRITQRQTVNIPLMKETIKTIISKVDEFPDIYFEELNGDKEQEMQVNEYWKENARLENLSQKDIVDKKQVALYGRSFIKLYPANGRIVFEILEPYDVVIDRFADPTDIRGTANYVCHRNIFRTISQLVDNPLYDQKVVDEIRLEYAKAMNIQRVQDPTTQYRERMDRLQDLGLWDIENPSIGETIIELREHYVRTYDDEKKKLRWKVKTEAANKVLSERWLEDAINIDELPITTWADDVERTDIWPDGVADIVRTPNTVVNVFFSQLVENRTLRNFGMNFYDSTKGEGKWIPQTYVAQPFGWYPVPGNPNELVKRVEIPDLSESLDELQFVISTVERATASTATEKGVKEKGQTTLGEIQLIQANATERITSMAKFYMPARIEMGNLWFKLVKANADKLDAVTLYKQGMSGKYYAQKVDPKSFTGEYTCKAVSSAERSARNIEEVQKVQAVLSQFPDNPYMKQVAQKKFLDLLDLTPEETQAIMEFEEQKLNGMATGLAQPAQPNAPKPSPIDLALEQQNAALAGMTQYNG